MSFKTRQVLAPENQPWDFTELTKMAQEIDDKNALKDMESFQRYLDAKQEHQAMRWAFGAPAVFTGLENVFVLVMIDEIQFMTKYIFHDQERQILAHNLPGAYHGLVESKVAPMLVSGSYIGWMMQMMHEMFVGGRLKQTPISPKLAEEEGMEAVYQYAQHNNKTVSDEAAVAINLFTQSDPFYIASLFRSDWEHQDFNSVDGAMKTLAFEIRNTKGELFGTWSEYIYSTIKEVNDQYAKKIMLFLSKDRYKEYTRIEISNHLGGKLSDSKLEKKLQALEYGDLITRPGLSHFRYCGIPDDILDLIFRSLYQEEIEHEKPNIENELQAKLKAIEKDKHSLQGQVNELKGRVLEWTVYRELNQSRKKGQPIKEFKERLRSIKKQYADKMENMLAIASQSAFDKTWVNHFIPLQGTTSVEVDVLTEGADADSCWAFVFEMKNRDEKNLPSMKEAGWFVANVSRVKQWLTQQTGKPIKFICPVYLSAEGFNASVEEWLHEQGVLTTDWAHWAR
ncbi:MAG: hypothetical protein DRR19_30540 [Candidatus Parabeggiatoa sp. nov. 1]|nr:MAG: hypothetical protein DRR19_30540 [Gammaproteobacteria bacterium]